MQTTGRSPRIASPAAKVTACCSAMPTSKKRSGKRCENSSSPVDDAIAAVIATMRSSASAASQSASPKTSVQSSALLGRSAAVRIERRDPMELVNLVSNCGAVALALVGDHVHHHRAADAGGVAQRLLDRLEVVSVDRPAVLEPERLEDRDRRDQLLERVLHAPGGLVRGVPDRRQRAQRGPGRILGRLVPRRQAEMAEVLGDPADRRARSCGRCR